MRLGLPEFVQNPENRCPVILLLDTSASMRGEPMAELNAGLRAFHHQIMTDDLASLQQEIGLGKAEAIEEIEIWWPGQEGRQVFRGPEMDRAYLAEEGATMLQPVRGGDS